jgi:hypothetical protein
LREQRFAGVFVAARADLVADVGDHQQRGLRLGFRDERAHARKPREPAFARELAQRAVHGHARDAERGHQIVFRWNAVAGLPGARFDRGADVVLDLLVAGHRRVAGMCRLARAGFLACPVVRGDGHRAASSFSDACNASIKLALGTRADSPRKSDACCG